MRQVLDTLLQACQAESAVSNGVTVGCGCSSEWPSKFLHNPRAFTMKFNPSPSPSAKAQELWNIHFPSLASFAWSILAGPTRHTESGFGSMLLFGKNHRHRPSDGVFGRVGG